MPAATRRVPGPPGRSWADQVPDRH